ncbi:MAG: Na/Pi cotransporter family protein [Bacteroidales bacterium]|jgi:phosphate:Na+ symporter|nr:Na/Pi cotransporter family protein [Bacteroidales bacterium]MCI1784841.1 Na/Pi cotransporter family protein [Bacteroidales bacterium]
MQIAIQVFTLLGSLAMFLYGMTLMSEGLQKAAGDRLRSFLESMTSTRFKRVLTGIIITALIQSSSGTTVMVVSMVNAGLLSLANGIGVIMGANIGTTVTAWIISLFGFSMDISKIAIPFVAFGFIFTLSRKSKNRNIGQFIIGFSLLIIGLSAMKSSVPDLNSHPDALAFVRNLTGFGFGSELIFLAIGTLLTIVLQASSATMALTLVFVSNGWIDFNMAASMVLGENIGTTITANIAAVVANYSAKRAARAHTVFNVFGVIWVLSIFPVFLRFIGHIITLMGLPNPNTSDLTLIGQNPDISKSVLYGICTLHTLFNVTNTLILIWFIPQIEKMVTLMVPTPEGEGEVFRLKFIQGGPLSTAELSLDEAKQEVIHFSEICYKGFGYVRSAVNETDKGKFDELNSKLVKYEEITDRIEYEIAAYLSGVSKGEISARSASRIKGMYTIIGEMESLGDSGEAIGRLLRRRNEHGSIFDGNMMKKLNRLMDLVDDAYKAMTDNLRVSYSSLKDITNAQDAEYNINEYRNSLREEHIANIESDTYNYQTGVFYMDLVAELEKMGDFLINISEAQIEENED